METRAFGRTGLSVPALGLGAGPLGDPRVSDSEAERLLHAALDLGVTLIDTARSYGASEERIGRALRDRRGRALLATKVGYGIPGVLDWSAEAIRRGVDEALVKLKTDTIDIVHLHSPSLDTVRAGEAAGALAAAVRAGKVRVAAYSGDNEALDAAVFANTFGSIELSLSPWDQGAIDRVLWRAKELGLGAIAKRPLGNAWWTQEARPSRSDLAEYWDRGRALALPDFGLPREALAVRFAVFTWGIDSAIAGTTNLNHLQALVSYVADGPLPEDVRQGVREIYRANGAGWPGLV